MGDRTRRTSVAYLAAQAVTIPMWWLSMAAWPSVRGRFELDAGRRAVLDSFLLADLVLLVAGSAFAAWATARGDRRAPVVVAAVAGASASATLYLVAWVLDGGHGWSGIPPMVAATVVTAAIAARPGPAG